jgi:AraC-like DNA-binding protein
MSATHHITEPIDNSPQMFRIEIEAKNSTSIIQFLVEKQIPFKFSPMPKNSTNEATGFADIQKKRLGTHSEIEIIEQIHEKYIMRNIEQVPPLEKDIAEEFGIAVLKFKVLFKHQYDRSFYQLYVDTKMEHAAMLLKSGLRANVVSDRVGYSHPIKFSKMFQKHFGIAPKKYQQANGITTSKRLKKTANYESLT